MSAGKTDIAWRRLPRTRFLDGGGFGFYTMRKMLSSFHASLPRRRRGDTRFIRAGAKHAVRSFAAALLALFATFAAMPAAADDARTEAPIKLSSFAYLETSRADSGRYIDADSPLFTAYDNANLRYSGKFEKSLFVFKTEFVIPETWSGIELSLYCGPAEFPSTIYLNGQSVLSRGRSGNPYRSIDFVTQTVFLSRSLLKTDGRPNVLVVEAFPEYETEALYDLFVGERTAIGEMAFLRNMANVHLIQGATVMAAILFVYFLLLFGMRRKKETKHLYFALVCLSFILSYVNILFFYDAADEVLLQKISRMGFPLTVAWMTLFIFKHTEVFASKKWIRWSVAAPNFIAAVVIGFMGSKRDIYIVFNQITSFIFTPLFIWNLSVLAYAFYRKKQKEAGIIFLAFAFMVFMGLLDIRYLNEKITPFYWHTAYGYIALVVSIFIVVALEQSKVYAASEADRGQLDEKNRRLTAMIAGIKQVSESIQKTGVKLDAIISASLRSIAQYEQRNKEIQAAVLNQFKRIETVMEGIKRRFDAYADGIPRSLESQLAFVERVSATIAEMKAHSESTLESALSGDAMATDLSTIASKTTATVHESVTSIKKISDYSISIGGILTAINEIAERTSILSINAAIESARAGAAGKGFAVLAAEVRKMAEQSKDNLKSSQATIDEMRTDIDISAALSNHVSTSLDTIIGKAHNTASLIQQIAGLVKEQEEETGRIMASVNKLLEDTQRIMALTDDEQRAFASTRDSLADLKTSFIAITDQLDNQREEGRILLDQFDGIKAVLSENLHNAEILERSVREDAGA